MRDAIKTDDEVKREIKSHERKLKRAFNDAVEKGPKGPKGGRGQLHLDSFLDLLGEKGAQQRMSPQEGG